MLSGCQTMPGQFNGLGTDYMSKIFLDREDGLPITMPQYMLAQREAGKCDERIDIQLSDPIEGIATGTVAYGASGVVGGVGGYAAAGAASGVFPVIAAIGGAGGAANGAVSSASGYSADVDKLTGNCTQRHLRWYEKNGTPLEMALAKGLDADSSSFRTKNRIGHPAKGLVEDLGFSGDRTSK